jgi:hypothetical protein
MVMALSKRISMAQVLSLMQNVESEDGRMKLSTSYQKDLRMSFNSFSDGMVVRVESKCFPTNYRGKFSILVEVKYHKIIMKRIMSIPQFIPTIRSY